MVPKQVWWKLRASLLAAGVDVVVTLHFFSIFPYLFSGAPLLDAASLFSCSSRNCLILCCLEDYFFFLSLPF